MSEKFVLAYDLGTSGVKAALVTPECKIIQLAVERYPVYTDGAGMAEQDPADYWDATVRATREVMALANIEPAQVAGLAFCSQWKAIIPLGANDELLHRGIIWLDSRATSEAASMNRILQFNWYKEKLLGFKPSSKINAAMGRSILCGADYWPKLMWFKDNLPEVYKDTKIILECNSYVKWRATGVMVSDMTGHFTKSYSKSSQGLYDMLLKLGKVNPDLFPDIIMPEDQAGLLSEEAAEQLGLVSGTPVFGGCGDIPAVSIGSGCAETGDTHIYLGTSGWLASIVLSSEGFLSTSPFDLDRDVLCFGFQAIGLAFDWAISTFYAREKEELGESIYTFIEQEIANISPGSDGLVATHWLHGERPPFFGDDAKGAFVGLNETHKREHMLRAIMESICYSMRLALDALRSGTNREIPEVSVVGGCAASTAWMQMMSDVLGIRVKVPEKPRHSGTIGAASCALRGLGMVKDLSDFKQLIVPEKVFEPDPAAAEAYEKPLAVYRRLYPTLKQL